MFRRFEISPVFFLSVICVVLTACLNGCSNSGAKTDNAAENKAIEAVVYKTGNAECDKAMTDLDEVLKKINTDQNASADLKNKAYLAELDKRSLLKSLNDPNNKPDEKLQITGKCREIMEQKIKELNSTK